MVNAEMRTEAQWSTKKMHNMFNKYLWLLHAISWEPTNGICHNFQYKHTTLFVLVSEYYVLLGSEKPCIGQTIIRAYGPRLSAVNAIGHSESAMTHAMWIAINQPAKFLAHSNSLSEHWTEKFENLSRRVARALNNSVVQGSAQKVHLKS